MIRTLILAAGDGIRWAEYLGVPKHLVRIEGQRLLDRTVEQFAEIGEVEIVAPADHRYEHPRAQTSHAILDPANGEADRFLSSRHRWDLEATMILAFGDVWFSDECVAIIGDVARYDFWSWVARFGPSAITGCNHAEGFAFVLPPGTLPGFADAIDEALRLWRAGQIRTVIGWTVWQVYAGGDPTATPDAEWLPHLINVDDWTDDFDYPHDYERWTRRRQEARR
jgi:hypothetical protein